MNVGVGGEEREREREKATIRSVCGTEGSERDVETSRRRMLDQRAAPQLCIVSHPIIPLSNPERKTRGANRIDPARPPRVKLVFFLCQLSVPFTLRVDVHVSGLGARTACVLHLGSTMGFLAGIDIH